MLRALPLWLLFVVLLGPSSSLAETRARTEHGPDPQAAFAKLEAWVAARGGSLGAVVLDLNTSDRWVAIDADKGMNPASNQKLLTAAVALAALGGDYRYRTALYGKVTGASVRHLALTGHGDPSLGVEDLWRLARALKAQGVSSVEGPLLVDQSRFDESYEPPAYNQQPDEWAGFRAPVSAISVEQNTVTLNVVAGEAGQPALHWFEPAGIVQESGSIETKPSGHGQTVSWRVSPAPGGLASVVGGHVSEGQPRLRFVRRVADPRLLPGKVLVELLRNAGVQVTGRVELGGSRGGARLAYLTSAPLSVLLHELGKHSDNFYAETIFKTLGGDTEGAPASSEAAARRMSQWLAGLGLLGKQTKIVNGSGLFDANRIAPSTLAAVLARVYLDPVLGPDFLAHLAIGGVDGTLKARFRHAKVKGRIRAKTGTLNGVDALAGYVLSDSGRLPIAFVVLVNGIQNRHQEVRAQIDRAVSVLAEAGLSYP